MSSWCCDCGQGNSCARTASSSAKLSAIACATCCPGTSPQLRTHTHACTGTQYSLEEVPLPPSPATPCADHTGGKCSCEPVGRWGVFSPNNRFLSTTTIQHLVALSCARHVTHQRSVNTVTAVSDAIVGHMRANISRSTNATRAHIVTTVCPAHWMWSSLPLCTAVACVSHTAECAPTTRMSSTALTNDMAQWSHRQRTAHGCLGILAVPPHSGVGHTRSRCLRTRKRESATLSPPLPDTPTVPCGVMGVLTYKLARLPRTCTQLDMPQRHGKASTVPPKGCISCDTSRGDTT